MRAKIYISLKKSVHDPQGEAVKHALTGLGHRGVQEVRVGKFIELKLNEEDAEKAKESVTQMCEKLLSNTIIESYHFELEP
ncbi:MAG: phosphoribosylformylglycinamidine synthase [Deltaproteobacteria bacterium CG_4_10_14_0_2_um_filter_43_8]|nr:MAG: phosphoribosylformylglycinamidine synthase [Deltaproteobacteria bacterium CG11_big_fil_rev_8_21_14_0_20_42_23]PJA20006.1 MAG: phosphoribosylformylglycinamidine synthase [Deltaproteobacteria bacterium CG_4_10_14_0_2_um_filter_43_8]PJC64338.1 MAG: phosphoribosylformylglycinamidine synthase [Deltaproteobacteria bacterium CG_4_9_14_0_2_um_filter_42_21]